MVNAYQEVKRNILTYKTKSITFNIVARLQKKDWLSSLGIELCVIQLGAFPSGQSS